MYGVSYPPKHIGPVTFSIDGEPIEQVHYFKFLGIMFEEHLTWKNHINMITSKLSKLNGILSRVKVYISTTCATFDL